MQKPLLNKVKTYSFVDRYMTRYFNNDGTYIYDHTNDLILLGISKALIDKEGGVKNLEFLFK